MNSTDLVTAVRQLADVCDGMERVLFTVRRLASDLRAAGPSDQLFADLLRTRATVERTITWCQEQIVKQWGDQKAQRRRVA